MHNNDGLGEGEDPAQQLFPPQSLAERIWENKWTWAVGRTWRQHIFNLGVYVALMTGLVAHQQPPAAILEKVAASWSPWQREVSGVVFLLLVTLPGYLATIYVICSIAAHVMVQGIDKLATYFGADLLKQFLDRAVRVDDWIVLDLTPQGGLSLWVLFLFWPLGAYQWCLAGVFAAVALCLPRPHRFPNLRRR